MIELHELIGMYPNFEHKITQMISEIVAYEQIINEIKQLIIDEKLTPMHINSLVKIFLHPSIELHFK